MTRTVKCFAASILATWTVAAELCFAWGADGHRIVGTIAASQLSPEATKAVAELLGEHNIADSCYWADEMRSNPAYDWVKPLHYINVPRGATTVDMKRDGLDGQQVVGAIQKYRVILADKSLSKEERLLALRLLLHFIGDIHQPLHASYSDDKGGNLLTVRAFGAKSNMHKVWDSDLITHEMSGSKSARKTWQELADDLRKSIKPRQIAQWKKSLDPVAWADESLAVAIQIHANLPKPPTESGGDDVAEPYAKRWTETVHERLQTAGVRLAAVLNEALGSAAAPATKPAPASARPAAPPPATP